MMKNILSKYAMVFAIFCFYQTALAQEISSFTLINAEEDIEIGVLADGDSIHIPDLNTNELSIRANNSGQIGSIVFRLDGEIIRAENTPPYALFGKSGSNYNSWTPEFKTYRITATAHSFPQGQGTLLYTYSILATFTDQTEEQPTGPDVQSLVLINADTDKDIAEITEGAVFNLAEIGTSNLNIRAEADNLTQSVVFDYQDVENYHTESLIEYAIGANDDSDYRPWIADLGANTVTATAYTKDRGEGISGNSLTLNFEIIEEVIPEEIAPFVLRINSGGEAVMTNDSIQFIADTLYYGSSIAYSNYDIVDILETTYDSIYKTERTTNGSLQSFAYNIPVSDGEYEVKLHLAEIFWGATGGYSGGEGKRLFSVSIEGQEAFTDYDMNAESEPMTAIIKTFTTTVSDGELNIDFGASVNQPKVSALEIHEIKTDIEPMACDWTELADSALSKLGAQSVKVNDKLYVMGTIVTDSTFTRVTEIYDPANNTWSLGSPIPTAVAQTGAVGVADEIWVIAGVEGDSISVETNKVQIYNTITDSWSTGPSLPTPQSSGAAAFSDGKIHFFGGQFIDSISEVAHYVLDVNNIIEGWQTAAPLPDTRSHLGAAVVNGKIYAIGGQSVQDSLVVDHPFLDEYVPESDSWTRKADLPSARSHFNSGTVVYGNKIIIIGGIRGDSLLNNITEYNVLTDSWSELCLLPSKTSGATAAIFEDQLIVTNGSDNEPCCSPNLTISMRLEPEIQIEIPEEDTEISVLVYHETGGFRHGSIDAGIAMVTEFGNELGWKVEASQTSDVFAGDSLSTYDVVIWLNTTGEDLLTDTEEAAFETYIQNGGGFVGVHSATDTYRNGSWLWYNDLVGAIVQVNPYHTANNTSAIIDVVGEHAAVEHLGNEWNKKDEYYYWERNGGYLFSGNIDLLTVQATGANSYDAARPVTWFKEYDGGRSFYTALGHNASDYEGDENFRTMLQEAIIWAAEKGELTIADEIAEVDTTLTENNVIVLFPNPVIDQLYVDTVLLNDVPNGTVSIYGFDGALMKQKIIEGNDPRIDMSDLPAGYYAVVLEIGTTIERHMIYKQ